MADLLKSNLPKDISIWLDFHSSTEGECRVWDSTNDDEGHGIIAFSSEQHNKIVNYRAERVSYVIHVRDLANGEVVWQKCGNLKCINPAHLEAISKYEHDLRRGLRSVTPKE